MPSKDVRPSFALYCAIALISAAVLGYEVALTRVFAVLLRYQFAFLVISLALCGLGLGGLFAHFAARRGRRFSPEGMALFFGISAALSLLLILRVIFAYRPDQFWLAALLVLVPFGGAGAFLSDAFSRHPTYVGRLYGWDLAGAALAAVVAVLLMQFCGAIDACLIFAALGGIAALYAAPKPRPSIVIGALCLVLLWPINQASQLWSVQPMPPLLDANGMSLADRGVTQPLYTELGDPRYKTKVLDSRWNAFARTDVVLDPHAPNSYLLYTNGNVPTNMMNWDGKSWTIPAVTAGFTLSDWTYESANLKGANVLSIGPGGGLDALLSLRYGAKNFDGAEINPSIVGLMSEPRYAAFNGGIYSKPGVNVRTAEGRAFVREQHDAGKRYKLLFSALTKTATAGQGMALLESFIYTQDAFHDYLNALEDDGILAVVGDAPGNYPFLLARLFVTAMTELKARGMSQKEAAQCIAMVYDPRPGPYQWALLVRKTPFERSATFALEESALKRNLRPLWIPNQAQTNEPFPFAAVGNGELPLADFVARYRQVGLDLSACSDNRPFVLDLATSPFTVFRSSFSLTVLLGLAIFGTMGLAAWTLRSTRRSVPQSGRSRGNAGRHVLYFLALGVGFMMVEIPLIQKLILPLGYPTLALTVILFAVLLGGGAGALFSQRYEGERLRRHALLCALGVVVGSLLFAATSGPLGEALLQLSLPVRIAVTTLLLMPLGFLLGTPFPSGIRLFGVEENSAAGHSGDSVPLIWALNGTASVVGSMAAAVGAKMGGFSAVMLVGAAIYLGAAWLLATHKQAESG